jgi:hypothetical protein
MPDAPAGYVAITGQTYAIRERLKELGGYWDAEARCWYVPEEHAGEAQRAMRNRPAEWRSPNRWNREGE